MKPRITMSLSEDGEFELWLNPLGRDLLVQKLQGLNEADEHFHLGSEDIHADVPVQTTAYREGDRVLEWGKVLFRLDNWDAEHFPHVLAGPANGS